MCTWVKFLTYSINILNNCALKWKKLKILIKFYYKEIFFELFNVKREHNLEILIKFVIKFVSDYSNKAVATLLAFLCLPNII